MNYGAIDLHLRSTWIRVVEPDGTPVLERKIPTTREALMSAFGDQAHARILIESGTESEWVAQTIEACGHEVIVASPNYALMYGHRNPQIKTDRRDVVALAEACRQGIYRPPIECLRSNASADARYGCASSWSGPGRN